MRESLREDHLRLFFFFRSLINSSLHFNLNISILLSNKHHSVATFLEYIGDILSSYTLFFSLLFSLSLVGPSIYITSRYTQYINTSIHHTFPHPPHSVVPRHRLRHLLFIQLGSSSTHPLYLLAFLFSSTLSSLASLSCYMMQIHYESSSAKSKSHSFNSIS